MTQTLVDLWRWLSADPLLAAAVIGGAIVAFWKALPLATRTRIEQRYPRVVGWLRAAVALLPDVLGALRVIRYQGIDGRPRRLVSDAALREAERLRESQREDQRDDRRSERGSIEHDALAVIAVSALAVCAALLCDCTPALPRDALRHIGAGVAITASAGRDLALREAAECLEERDRARADRCVAEWRERWIAVAQAWAQAGARAQSLGAVIQSVEAAHERRWRQP